MDTDHSDNFSVITAELKITDKMYLEIANSDEFKQKMQEVNPRVKVVDQCPCIKKKLKKYT